MSCDLISSCSFYNNELTKPSHETIMYKEMYCTDDHQSCVRFLMSKVLKEEFISDSITPNDRMAAKELIESMTLC